MRRGCTWTLGSFVAVVLALALFGKVSPPVPQIDSQTKTAGPTKTPSYIDQLREVAGNLAQGITAQQYEGKRPV
jgi:hypothetical protein